MLVAPISIEHTSNKAEELILGIDLDTKLLSKFHMNAFEAKDLNFGSVYSIEGYSVINDVQEYTCRQANINKSDFQVNMVELLDSMSVYPMAIKSPGNHGNICKITEVNNIIFQKNNIKLWCKIAGFSNEMITFNIKDAKWIEYISKNNDEESYEILRNYLINRKIHNLYAILDYSTVQIGAELICVGLVLV